MTNLPQTTMNKPSILNAHELALVQNDLSKLNPQERLSLYNKTCESLGLNPLTQPFGFIEFRGGKLSLYAKKDCTDQLRKIHGVSVEIISKESLSDNFVVMARAKDSSGRVDEDMGSVSIKGLSGDNLGNAMMKAITKAKRRVTLSICGLGMLDETESETIQDAHPISIHPDQRLSAQNKTTLPQHLVESLPEKSGSGAPSFTSTEQQGKVIVNHAPQSASSLEDYAIRFTLGAFRSGTKLKDFKYNDLSNFINHIKAHVGALKAKDKDVPEQLLEFLTNASQYLEEKK